MMRRCTKDARETHHYPMNQHLQKARRARSLHYIKNLSVVNEGMLSLVVIYKKSYFNRRDVPDQEIGQKTDQEGGMIQEKGAHPEIDANTEAQKMPGGVGQGAIDSLKLVIRILGNVIISVGLKVKAAQQEEV